MKLIAKLFLKKNHLDDISCLQKPRTNNQIFEFSSSKNKDNGSSMVELLLATTLALIAVNTSADLINKLYTSGLYNRAAANSAVEVAINNDLARYRQQAVNWNRNAIGPNYNVPLRCGGTIDMAEDFLETVTHTAISLPSTASGYTLSRAIQPDNSVSGAVRITYTLTVPGTAPNTTTTIFVRSSSLYLPAAGWCP
jgi:hypothetical protein